MNEMQGKKFDQNKPRMSLLPKGALNAVIRVLEFGATKYQADGWKHVPDAKTRYYDAMQRHIEAWWNGEQKDTETGEHHLAHASLPSPRWFRSSGVISRVFPSCLPSPRWFRSVLVRSYMAKVSLPSPRWFRR